MGITTALNTTVGSNPSLELKMMSKLLVVACAAVAVSAEADAGVYGYAPALLNAYPNWPGVSTPYTQSTCFGCRGYIGKRSADADAEPGYLAYGYGLRPYGYGLRPFGATSFVARSPQGVGKRSADAEPGYFGYGYAPYAYGAYGIRQAHPTGYSHQHVVRGKRSADADAYYGYGYGYGRAY